MTGRKLSLFPILALACACTTPKSCLNYIECPDGMRDCYEQAKELCPTGYRQLNESDMGQDFVAFTKAHFTGATTSVPHILTTCSP